MIINFIVRKALNDDINSMVLLSCQKRRKYEKYQPQFRKYSGPETEKIQNEYFKSLIALDEYVFLVAEENFLIKKDKRILGFIIGKIIFAPEVYNPGGLTLMVDDFCVENSSDWCIIGNKLIQEVKVYSKSKGVVQVVVVWVAMDDEKRHFLKKLGLTVASEWYVGSVI